jgi:peptide/nickel transport system ATP-binding protein
VTQDVWHSAGPEQGGSPLLEVDDLSVTFESREGSSTVVDDISFRIDRHQTLGVVGESGSGKSMTSLAIMGLLPKGARTTGSVRFEGEELLGRSDKWLRRIRGDRIAMIFQDPLSSLNPYYTVGLQIEEAYRAHRGGSRKNARAVAIDAMHRVKIADAERRVDHYPHQFSGGMRQRIMIAMALTCEPDLIIADEPTTALDVTVQAQILDLISMLQAETGAGMLFITHDLAVVSQVADAVHVLQNGRTMEAGPTEQIFSRPQDPYTRRLLSAVPRIDQVMDDVRPVLGGAL